MAGLFYLKLCMHLSAITNVKNSPLIFQKVSDVILNLNKLINAGKQ